MLELYTITGTELASDIKDRVGDTGAVQITDTMILRWINQGARSISSRNPFLEMLASGNTLAGVASYALGTTFNNPRIISVEMVLFKGKPLDIINPAEWRRLIDGRELDEQQGDPGCAMFFGDTMTLWPVPQASEPAALGLSYLAMPASMTDISATLPLPDRLYNALADYVFAQALQQLEKFDESRLVLANHETHLQHQFEASRKSPSDYYPTFTLDPDSSDRPYVP